METADVAKVYVQSPCEALRPFIKRFLVIEFTHAHKDLHLPDTGMVAAFRYKGDCALDGGIKAPQAAITGLWDTMRSHNHGKDSAVVLAAFTATGATAFLRHPLDEFFIATVAMDGLLGRPTDLNRVNEHLAETRDNARRVQLIENILIARAPNARPDPLVSAAVSALLSKYGFGVVWDAAMPTIGDAMSIEIAQATRRMKHLRIVTADRLS